MPETNAQENASENPTAQTPIVWTIGHSNHALPYFLDLLRANQIAVLADVRSSPFSKFAPQFNSRDLEHAVQNAGLHYAFFGDTLGGRPQGDEFYDAAGHVLYNRVAVAPFFQEGLVRLRRGLSRGAKIALMCSEENPDVCHRHLLVGRVLEQSGVGVLHIRGNGACQSSKELNAAKREAERTQPALFEMEAEETWRSIPSVLPKRPPSGFSGD